MFSKTNTGLQEEADVYITNISKRLLETIDRNDRQCAYASAKRVLLFMGTGATIAASLLSPRFGTVAAREILKEMNKRNSQWKSFNTSYLKQTLRRLEKQSVIERKTVDGNEAFCITREGKTKLLNFALENLKISKMKKWDGKWRVILYDIEVGRKHEQEAIRRILKKLGFYQVQKSVYIIPYRCFDEIEYLRLYFDIRAEIKYWLVEQIEDDSVYRTYFGLDTT
jgi:DNA-binding PadR family transcriptional regulator